MPKGRVTINGVMIDLGSVRFFNKKERVNKKVSKECTNEDSICKDYGIEFQFYKGGNKTVWWITKSEYATYYPLVLCHDHRQEKDRDKMYDKLSTDFNIRDY